MPRNYVKKACKYPEARVNEAVKNIIEKKLSFREASEQDAIDRTFLFRKVHNRNQSVQGRKTALTREQESSLATNLKLLAKWGFPLNKQEVQCVVREYVEINNLNTVFRKNGPGDDWFREFIKRNKLSLKKPEPLEAVRRKATGDPFIIYNFYDILEEQLTALDLNDKPSHIWNLDETAFNFDPSRGRAVGEKGKLLHRNIQGSGRENTTVMACASAAGRLLSP